MNIGSVAVHEATHVYEYVQKVELGHEQNANLMESLPVKNQKLFEDWFKKNQLRILRQHPELGKMLGN